MGGKSSSLRRPEEDADDGRMIFEWKIEGVSSLLDKQLGEKYYSDVFEAEGCLWRLRLVPVHPGRGDGKRYICLGLVVKYIPSDSEVQVKHNLLLYDHKHSKYGKITGPRNNLRVGYGYQTYMISIQRFRDASLGFLINDSCVFGVEILRVFHTSRKVVSECLSLCKEPKTHAFHTWKIESCKMFPRADYSETFDAVNLKWNILVSNDRGEGNKYLSLFLLLDRRQARQLESGVYVEFSLCIKSQINGKHKKLTKHAVFSSRDRSHGWSQFLLYEDFNDPSKGFFIDNSFTVEASLTVLGSVTYDIRKKLATISI